MEADSMLGICPSLIVILAISPFPILFLQILIVSLSPVFHTTSEPCLYYLIYPLNPLRKVGKILNQHIYVEFSCSETK